MNADPILSWENFISWDLIFRNSGVTIVVSGNSEKRPYMFFYTKRNFPASVLHLASLLVIHSLSDFELRRGS